MFSSLFPRSGGSFRANLHALFAALVPLAAAHLALADSTSNDFSANPLTNPNVTVVGDASRFTYDPVAHTLTAAYDSTQPTAKLEFPLASPITQADSFSYTTTFTINSIANYDDPSSVLGTAEISFGLLNSTLTGNDRGGGDAYDLATVDYFPANTFYAPPTLGATVINSSQSPGDFYDQINFDSGPASELPTFLNTGVPITANVSYDASSGAITATFSSADLFQGGGGPNSFTYTDILPAGSAFDFDSFGLALWDDSDFITAGYDVPVSASVTFSGFSVTSSAPEPASLMMLAAGTLLLAGRRSHRRQRTFH